MGNLAAARAGLPQVRFYGAGTAPSEFNPRTVEALRAFGLRVEPSSEAGEANPIYRVAWGDDESAFAVEFSKALGAAALPITEFAPVMVCDEADTACPFVPEAALWVSMPFAAAPWSGSRRF